MLTFKAIAMIRFMTARQAPSSSDGNVEDELDNYAASERHLNGASLPFMGTKAGINIKNLDLTPQVRSEEAKRGLTILNEIINLLPIGITLETIDGRVLFANRTAVQISRVEKDLDLALLAGPAAQADKPKAFELEAARTSEVQTLAPDGTHTLLTARKPIHVNDEILFLSATFDITDRKRIEEELSRRAYFDELTGLPNRCQIQAQVQRVLDSGQTPFALAFLDIDNFKHINDYYGHANGDVLLEKVAQRITNLIRATDMLARISGDEFMLLLEPVDTKEQISAFIMRFLEGLKKPFFIDGFEIIISASVGVSIYPDHGTDYETLRRNADTAMYQVKSGTKDNITIFDPELAQAVAVRVEREQRLRLAIRDQRFRCAFQPKVDILTQAVVGVEALVRLVDEDGMIKPPSSFIQLAVELGLMDDLTLIVVNQVINSIDHLNEAFGPDITISVNVAAQQAGDILFMTKFVQALKNTSCTSRFMVEITEDAFVSQTQFETQVLPMLRDIGVRVSIDDFGTGYSSLSALIGITADEIKIDRSFITDIQNRPRSQSVLKAIESLSDALGMTIIAEGVETIEELTYLQTKTHIRYAQGYYFAKPLFFEELKPHKNADAASRHVSRGLSGKPHAHSRFR